ncbi:hypothetical protein WOB59_21250 [Methylocystis sp. IM4]|uniref:hypothetical protein n=1 Tax=Methylocystis sp. IM4 TaxID=3136560 RepID=UPI0031192B00
MSTEWRIEAANSEMAAIADIETPPHDRRDRMRAIWQPIVQALADASRAAPEQEEADPNYVGFTSDTGRPVFLAKVTSPGGLVYRKFVARRS